jgi:VIT1/CCC1 family predicted Fe2+/Mn2+ transporter
MTRAVDTRRWMLPFSLGVSDGILNALILASAPLFHGGSSITVGLAMRVGCVAFVTAVFTMFIAEYSELRSRLSRSTQQLNLSAHGHLAATRLGRQVVFEAAQAAVVASASSFVGAVAPLLIAGSIPGAPWLGLVVAIALLSMLGVALAASVGGDWRRWAGGLVVAGGLVAVIGSYLNVT